MIELHSVPNGVGSPIQNTPPVKNSENGQQPMRTDGASDTTIHTADTERGENAARYRILVESLELETELNMASENARLLDGTKVPRSSFSAYNEGYSVLSEDHEELGRDHDRPTAELPSCNIITATDRLTSARGKEEREIGEEDQTSGNPKGTHAYAAQSRRASATRASTNEYEGKMASGNWRQKCFFRGCPPRHVVVTCVACFVVQFTMGITYTTGNMLPYLTSYLRQRTDKSVGYANSMWFAASRSITVSAVMPLLGLMESHLSPWGFRLLGIVLFSGSYFGASWAIRTSFAMTVVITGLIQGCGQAILYPACLSLPLQWLPHKRGLLGGLIMAGFGGGSFLWDQVITTWINPHNLQPVLHVHEDFYFNQTTVLDNVPTCYLLLGGILTGVQIICLLCMSYPSQSRAIDVKTSGDVLNDVTSASATSQASLSVCDINEGFNREENEAQNDALLSSSAASAAASVSASRRSRSGSGVRDTNPLHDYSPRELLRSRAMWTITIFCFFADLCVDSFLDFYKAYGQTFVPNDRLLSLMASFGSAVNAVSRPLWGSLADRLGFQPCLMVSLAVLSVGSALLVVCERVGGEGGAALLFFVVLLLFLAVGGMYGLQYTLIFLLFGSKHFTFNLGCLSFSGVFSSLIDIYVVKVMKQAFGWHGMFLVASAFALVGLLVNWSLVCSCGHPLPAHTRGPLFHPRRPVSTGCQQDTDAAGRSQPESC